jgi:hypothetical protein
MLVRVSMYSTAYIIVTFKIINLLKRNLSLSEDFYLNIV